MIKIVNHEAVLAKTVSLGKLMIAAIVGTFFMASGVFAEVNFGEEAQTKFGEKAEMYWDYGIRWAVIAAFSGLAIGNLINEQKYKLGWIPALGCAVVFGGFGKEIWQYLF